MKSLQVFQLRFTSHIAHLTCAHGLIYWLGQAKSTMAFSNITDKVWKLLNINKSWVDSASWKGKGTSPKKWCLLKLLVCFVGFFSELLIYVPEFSHLTKFNFIFCYSIFLSVFIFLPPSQLLVSYSQFSPEYRTISSGAGTFSFPLAVKWYFVLSLMMPLGIQSIPKIQPLSHSGQWLSSLLFINTFVTSKQQ